MDSRGFPIKFAPDTLLKLSVLVAVFTIALKTWAWRVTGSVGLLSDALESVVNLAGAVFGLAMVIVARRPADEDHPYGHNKAEYFASGFEGMMIFCAAAGILWTALPRFVNPQPLVGIGWGLTLSAASSALNGVLAWALFRGARQHRSIALEADARHLLADVWTSAGVIIGVAAVALTGWLWLDALVAMGVALNILWEGGRLMWRSSQGLMDEAAEPEVLAAIEQALADFAHRHAGHTGAVGVRFDHLSTRRAGRRYFADLHVHMPADWSLARAAAVRANVEQSLAQAVPGLRATIQLLPSNVEPQPLGAES